MRSFWLSFLVATVLGALWAALVALLSERLRVPLIALPTFTLAFGLVLFWRRCFRFVGFFSVLPVSILGFEILQSTLRPSLDVHPHVTLDRAHYLIGERIRMPKDHVTAPGRAGWGENEILIGPDGFRADPESGVGNPARCRSALIGDSVIFGSGLPYHETLGPTLKNAGLDACIFGVAGNGPANYLATLRHIKDRLDSGGHVAIYLFGENDFSWTLHVLSTARWWWLSDLVGYYDNWRRSTFLFRLVHGGLAPASEPTRVWELQIGSRQPVKLLYNPADYVPPASLGTRERRHLEFFFKNLLEVARGHAWRLTVVIIPVGKEILANLASRNSRFQALDRARVEAVRMCTAAGLQCEDLTPYLYTRAMARGKNPYFTDDRSHFSAFGTRVLAEHYQVITGRLPGGTTINATSREGRSLARRGQK